MEIRDVFGYEDLYKIDEYGNVYSHAHRGTDRSIPRKLRPFTTHKGYLRVTLTKDGIHTQFSVHRLVLEAFDCPCPNGSITRHLDSNRKNNHISNLKWGTHKENSMDAINSGTQARGETQGNSKLKAHQVKMIKALLDYGVIGRRLAEWYDVSDTCISKIKHCRKWKHILTHQRKGMIGRYNV